MAEITPPEHLMDVRLRSVHQLFNSMDPSPFVDRDLDQDAEAYIVGWAREFPRKGEFRLVFHVEDFTGEPAVQEEVGAAVRHFFDYRARVVARELSQLLKEGRLSLLIGLLFLGGCLFTARYISGLATGDQWAAVASEGLVIGGWVAMWRPLEIFLYAWWPLARKRAILSRLARTTVELRRAG